MQQTVGTGEVLGGGLLATGGASSLNSTVRKVMPRVSYNPSYYRRKSNII